MNNETLFSMALGLQAPWKVKDVTFSTEVYRLKVLFDDLWEMPAKPAAEAFLRQWCVDVELAKIPAFLKFANTVRAHWSGMVHFVTSRITKGIFEGINSKIQLVKRQT
jgi:transposase